MSLPKWMEQETYSDFEGHLKKALSIAWEALNNTGYGTYHIRNDNHGNVFGPPDGVMCKRIAVEAVRRIEELGK